MGRADFLELGSFNADCDRCGAKRKAEDLALEWDGLRVCRDRCLEPRQPQDFVRGKTDKQAPPWTRPDPPDSFLTYPLSWDGTSALLWDSGATNTVDWL